MQQPRVFVKTDLTLVCKLKKSLYGSNHAPMAWYEKLHQALVQFMYKHQDITMYTLVYVFDILLNGTSPKLIHALITQLHDKFARKQLGTPKCFLGIEVPYRSKV